PAEPTRALALERYRLLQPHFDEGVLLARLARNAGIGLRTAERWAGIFRIIWPGSFRDKWHSTAAVPQERASQKRELMRRPSSRFRWPPVVQPRRLGFCNRLESS